MSGGSRRFRRCNRPTYTASGRADGSTSPGPSIEIGSAHGDPGRFVNGTGPELPYGEALAFGDYRCRSDPAGLYCVNYAHQSAARFSDAGIVPFGCLQKVTPPPDIGEKYSC